MKVYSVVSCTLCKCELEDPNANAHCFAVCKNKDSARAKMKVVTDELVDEAITWDDEPYEEGRVKETITSFQEDEDTMVIEYQNGYDEPVVIKVRVIETEMED